MSTGELLYLSEVKGAENAGKGVVDASSSQVLPAVLAAGWRVEVTDSPEKARQLLDTQLFGVGLTELVPELDLGTRRELDALCNADHHMRWVALVSPQVLADTELCRFVSSAFHDYHTSPVDLQRLLSTLGHANGMAHIARAVAQKVQRDADEPEMVGVSSAMRAVFRDIRKVAGVDAPVLVRGESGTGKELAARAIHERSQRAAGPFVAVNCAALPATIIQSELFGHEQGAFTGAQRRSVGRIEAANGGTLFLDEIGDLSPELQVNLLRFLQEGTIQRVGSTAEIAVDVRVLAATHVDLERCVGTGAFREDLYFRLNVLTLQMPALRERAEDIEVLARFFFERFSREKNPRVKGFSQQAMERLRDHSWPGNVRELINRVRRAMVMCDRRLITTADLGLGAECNPPAVITLEQARSSAERTAVEAAFSAARNNLSRAARILAISRPALYRLMDRHGLSV